MKRRDFCNNLITGSIALGLPLSPRIPPASNDWMTVNGPLKSGSLGLTLIHEHIMVDFIGANETGPDRYQASEVRERALPFLLELKKAGCDTFVECTPAYIGRDVGILQELSKASGLNIISNTGYYGAVQGKYLPAHTWEESASELATRWIREWTEGIDGSGIFPGFIKIGVDKGPLNEVNRKLVEAAAITHKQTGLTISGHTGDGPAAMEQIEILKENGINPDAFRWVHAQNEKNTDVHVQAAREGAWVEFDGIRAETADEHLQFLKTMKENNLLHKSLISQDSGWYHVGEENGGNFRPFTYILEEFVPALKRSGFSRKEIRQLLVINPRTSLQIKIRG